MTKKKFILLLIACTFFAYFSSLGNPFIWDDEQFITSNQYVQQFDISKIFTRNTVAGAGVVSNYYRPLSSLSFAIDAKVWSFGSGQNKGLNPFGFHLTNLFFHIGAGIWLFLLLLEVGIGQWGSFLVSLFFLIHPVQVEAVSYINSRGDSMYAFFLFASLWLFEKVLGQTNSTSVSSVILRHQPKNLLRSFVYTQDDNGVYVLNKISLLLSSLVFYLFSILSKETAIAAFPLFFILLLINVFKNKINFAQSIQLYTKPILMAFVSVGIVAMYWVLRLTVLNFGNTLNYYTVQDIYSTHLWIRLLTFAKVLWVYMGLLVFPYPLHMERSVALVTSPFAWQVWGMVLVIVGVLILAWREIKIKHAGIILFGFSLSACLLLPVSGIIPINGILYEHWLYVPMVGFFLMGYGGWKLIIMSFRAQREISSGDLSRSFEMTRKVLISLGIIIGFLYVILTIRQNNIWSDPITFYSYTLQFAPDSARLHNNLGMSLADAGKSQQALIEYQKALVIESDYPQIYNNIGNVYMGVRDYHNAEIYLKKAIQKEPRFLVAHANLLKTYVLSRQQQKAFQEWNTIKALFPGTLQDVSFETYYNTFGK